MRDESPGHEASKVADIRAMISAYNGNAGPMQSEVVEPDRPEEGAEDDCQDEQVRLKIDESLEQPGSVDEKGKL